MASSPRPSPLRASCAAATPCSSRPRRRRSACATGETLLSDGPFAETQEQLGGFYLIECDTVDEAIGAAKRIPGALNGIRRGAPDHGVRLTGGGTTAVARVFREEYGRAVATLARILGDIDRAEDAIQEAFVIATTRWPADGTPRRPLAWIVTTARNRAIDAIRAERTRSGSEAARHRLLEGTAPDDLDTLDTGTPIPDERLGLIFACCHPALALDARVPLTLRLVAGLTVPEIGRGLLLPEATVAQRLVRAKRKIRDAAHPDRRAPGRRAARAHRRRAGGPLPDLLGGLPGDRRRRPAPRRLAEEAIRLARVLHELMPDEAEPLALLALMTLHHARRRARTDAGGALVLLPDQDRALWDRADIDRGVALVERALRMRRPAGPYALQAAIAAVHAEAPRAEDTDWPQILALYDALMRTTPTPVVALNRAVALAEVHGPADALEEVEALAGLGAMADWGPLHAARADMLRRLGRSVEAAAAYRVAAELSGSAAERAFLRARGDALGR